MDKITIRDLVKRVKWEKVQKSIRYFYPGDKGNYLRVFVQIAEMPKRTHRSKDERIQIGVAGMHTLEEDPEDRFYNVTTNKYSLSFRKWKELANIPLSEDTIRHYKFEDIVALFIWEITFYGTEEDAAKTAKELNLRVKEMVKQHKDELKHSKRVEKRTIRPGRRGHSKISR